MKEQNERFKQEMKQRAEEARKKKIEEKAKEKERQKEQKKIVAELLAEWKRPRDDLECDDLKELPKTLPVHCRIPNKLFGDFLTLLEFFHSFSNILECEDTFSEGITFELLEKALTDTDTPRGALFELLKFMLQALFDLQQEEDEEVKLDAKNLANVNIYDLDKNIIGKDEEVANQIRSATQWCRWCIKHQGQPIKALHLDEFTITEILRYEKLERNLLFSSYISVKKIYTEMLTRKVDLRIFLLVKKRPQINFPLQTYSIENMYILVVVIF